ncbi:tripartite tricarboxylate transporter substrate binding protein [Acidaminobacter hydrogenoformans]|uniref:Tripartite-type tricarboxylate transporter, receptor component TctC n=1 Tax=Acidaminobacter hydrogenoformans DSM 2784 TaxID=1120920 RepID=A0A1G5S7D5_9FIRM|nr:tripartite tricarboxylate transporter substrate binding protein [Acidaminobacter hydrogenoformans]SCZ81800.1 Tripartite-type tricarboxylate transporter, receptor component TctC [Acidaminobacter hydrogenoformans DSM 2784]
MKKKWLLMTALVMMLVLAFAGCSKPAEEPAAPAEPAEGETPAATEEFKFDRPIELIITFGPGSGTDTTIRALQPALEKELGVPVKINNKEGAGGVVGAEFYANQPHDGYVFAMYTPSHIIAAINKTVNFDIFNETIPVARLVHDSNVLLAGTQVPYSTVGEMIEYCKANPDYVPSVGMMSIQGIDGVAAGQLFDEIGIKANFIPYASGAEANAAIMGGHTDMVLTSPFDGKAFVDSGDMKAIVLLAEQRGSTLPETECTGELGINAYIGPWRGIVAHNGTPQEAIDALAAAIERADADPEWNEWKQSVGLTDRPGFAGPEEFGQVWTEYYTIMEDLLAN